MSIDIDDTIDNLEQRETLFQVLAESANIAIFLYRNEKLLYANPALEKFTGYSIDELKHKSGLDLMHPDIKDLIADRIRRRFAGEEVPNNYEIQFFTKSGEIRWADLSATLVHIDGKPAGMVTCVDITQRKLAEQKIQKSEQEMRHILENMQDTYYRTDLKGTICKVSPSISQLLGYKIKDVVGRKISDFDMDCSNQGCLVDLLKNNNGTIRNYESALRHRDGSEVWVSSNMQFYYDENGTLQGIEGTARDVTQVKQAHEEVRRHRDSLEEKVTERTRDLQAAIRELETFSYSVSHDLRAPLRSIDGFSQMLLADYADQKDEQFSYYLQRMRLGAQRMGALIDDLLQLSRVTSSELEKTQVDLSHIAEEVLALLMEQQPHRHVDIHIEKDLCVNGDEILLRLVIQNLIGNAWKYSQLNPDLTRIEFTREQTDKGKAFCIRDNGVGFDMQYAEKIFTPFHRLHSTDKYEGSGIGLATVQRIVQRHNGEVWAEGTPGEGARFWFVLD
ncbi:MAG: PAS domain S-box protein [Gammaproteobacteria bacterium]|nr:PAS domain S-box protein [Gammaproteobacteria bacterium]MDH5803036.1 PAS domain S-box protein [Gammaproteobacteria bacterium]